MKTLNNFKIIGIDHGYGNIKTAKRTDLTSEQFAPKLSTELIAEQEGTSKDTVKRYIRLTKLIPDILKMVDEQRIAFSVGVELSYLTLANWQT